MNINNKQLTNDQITVETAVMTNQCKVTQDSDDFIKDLDTYFKEHLSNQNFVVENNKMSLEDKNGTKIERHTVSWYTGNSSQTIKEKWEHSCTFVIPKHLAPKKHGLIVVNNGANIPNETITDNYPLEVLKTIAHDTGILIVSVDKVPNQPIKINGENLYEDKLVATDILRYLDGQEKNNPLIYFKMAGVVILTDKLAREQYPVVESYAITSCSKQVIGACLATQIYQPLQTACMLNFAMDPRAMPILGDYLVELSAKNRMAIFGPILGPYLEVAKHDRRSLLNKLMSQPLSSQWIHTVMGDCDTTFHKSKVQKVLEHPKNSQGISTYEEIQADHKGIKQCINQQMIHFVLGINQPGCLIAMRNFNGKEISLGNLAKTLLATDKTAETPANDRSAHFFQAIATLDDTAAGTCDDKKVVANERLSSDLQTPLVKHQFSSQR